MAVPRRSHIDKYERKNTQCGLVNIWLSDHQMIFCTRKIEKEKVGGHKQISFRSSENYSVDKYKIS